MDELTDDIREFGASEDAEAVLPADGESFPVRDEEPAETDAPAREGEDTEADEAEKEDAAEGAEKEEAEPRERVRIVTEAVVHERHIPRSSERSATFETAETLGEEGMSDSEFLAGGKPVIHYHLSDYDGPIDLLLELITKAKIDIEDIFVSDITRQYVEIITNLPKEEMDYEYAGEFITMAAKLVYLKSLCILPREEDDDDEFAFDAEAERQELLRKIKAFQLIKQEAEKLRERETINRFYRMPTYSEKDYRVVLTNFSLPKLVEAFARVMINADRRQASVIPKKVVKDRFSVADQMNHILEVLRYEKEFSFVSLFEPDFDNSDIVTTSPAVLELMKYGRLHAEQDAISGDIRLFAVDGAEDAPLDFKEDEDGKY